MARIERRTGSCLTGPAIWALLGSASLAAGCGEARPARPDAAPTIAARDPGTSASVRAAYGPALAKSGTFSIVAADPETGICGAAVASRYPAVGAVVPFVRAGVGAFCTQHIHNPNWGTRALELLAAGKSPSEVLPELLGDDNRVGQRQLAIIDMQGRTANHNPSDAPQGSRWWGSMAGRYYSCQGNTLTGAAVITSMASAYEARQGSLADRLLSALVAGDCAGGDHRGRLAAAIVVAKRGVDGNWLELRVDNSDDAVIELARKYQALEHEAKGPLFTIEQPWEHPCAERPTPKPPE